MSEGGRQHRQRGDWRVRPIDCGLEAEDQAFAETPDRFVLEKVAREFHHDVGFVASIVNRQREIGRARAGLDLELAEFARR